MNAEVSPDLLKLIVQGLVIFIMSIAVHEFGHAWMANHLGDSLPRRQGRLTLNPVAHIDPIGTILAPLLFLIMTGGRSMGFAWGKPVQHTTHDRKLRVFIAVAGPAMNIVLAVLVASLHVALLGTGAIELGSGVSLGLMYAVAANFMLFFFNLLPAVPLDGGSVARGLIPHRWVSTFDSFSVYGPFVLLAFLMIPQLGVIIARPAYFFMDRLYHVLTLITGVTTGY